MKNLFKMFKGMGKKQKLVLKLVGLFFFLCFILVLIFGILNNKKHSYIEIEDKLLTGAKSYFEDNKDLLAKQDGGSVSIDASKLIELKYMKDFKKYNKNAESCTGVVSVTNNNGNHLYIPSLKCKEYETTTLYDKILKEQGIVSEGDGLYAMGNDYIYRGEYPKNYVTFAKQLWRIIKLGNDKEIRLIQVDSYDETNWDDRYNVNSSYNSGITTFEISRIKNKLMKSYENDFKDSDKSYIVSKKLCIGNRKKKETKKDGSVECSKVTEEAYPVGMLQVNEYILASIDPNCRLQGDASCTNYNYLTKLSNSFWSITTSSANDYEAYYFSGTVRAKDAAEYESYRLTIHLNGNIPFKSGDGTKENPYVIY